jgi:hypothetical protein
LRLNAEELRREERIALDGYTRFAQWLDAGHARLRNVTRQPKSEPPRWLRHLRGWIFWRRHQARMPVPDAIRIWSFDAAEIRRARAHRLLAKLPPVVMSRASVVAEWYDEQQVWWLNFDTLDGIGSYLTEVSDDSGKLVRLELRSAFRQDAPPRLLNSPKLVSRTRGRDYDELYKGTRGSDGKEVAWRLSFLL